MLQRELPPALVERLFSGVMFLLDLRFEQKIGDQKKLSFF